MSHMIENDYTTYELNPQEELEGSILTISQKQVIQNDLSMAAQEILVLELDVKNPEAFIQDQAYKQGYMAALRWRLECSNIAEETKLDLLNQ